MGVIKRFASEDYVKTEIQTESESVEKNFDRFTNVFARLKDLENTVFKG